jgi:hypothetical protein
MTMSLIEVRPGAEQPGQSTDYRRGNAPFQQSQRLSHVRVSIRPNSGELSDGRLLEHAE